MTLRTEMRTGRGLPRWLLIGLIVLALAAAGWVALQRLAVERDHRTVELVLDYPETVRLAQESGKPAREVVAEFKGAGVTTLAVGEYTVYDYLRGGNVVAVTGKDLVAGEVLGRPLPRVFAELRRRGLFHPRSVYLLAGSQLAEREFEAALSRRFTGEEVKRYTAAGRRVWEVPRDLEWLLQQNLGLAPDQLRLAERLGLSIAPRWSNYPELTPRRLQAIMSQVPTGEGSVAIFSGKQILGYPFLLKETTRLLAERRLNFGYVEFADQDGEEALAKLVDYRLVRVHSITAPEMEKIKPSVAAARDLRAVRERNISVLYLRPFRTPEQVGTRAALTFNLDYIKNLKAGLVAEGFRTGRAEPATPLAAPLWAFVLLCLGSLAAGVTLLRRYVAVGRLAEAALILLGTLAAVAAVRAGYDLLIRQLFALGVGVTFATLGVLRGRAQLARGGQGVWLRGLDAFLTAILWSLAGSAIALAFLGETRFRVAIATFAGVKALHVLPLLLVWFAVARERLPDDGRGRTWRSLWEDLRRLLASPVTWEQAVLVVIAAAALAFYVLRTGTTTVVPTPGWERSAREALERWLTIRPRTKEFLIGHPALVLALLLEAWRTARGTAGEVAGRAALGRFWPLYLIGAIGQLSLIDTFSHIHTPLVVSGIRTGLGLLLGAVLGVLAFVVWRAAERLVRRTQTGVPGEGEA